MDPARSRLVRLAVVTAGVVVLAGCGGETDGADTGGNAADPVPGTAGVAPTTDDASTPTGAEPSGAASDEPSQGPSETPIDIEVTIEGGEVSTLTDRVRVAVGDTVRLVVHSDVADEVHVHGIEVLLPVEPGAPASLEFVVPEGTAPGLYEIETHESALQLLQLEVS